jgi:hypothetical protein
MRVKILWWGSIFTPENEQDKNLLKDLIESVGDVETYQPFYDATDCIYSSGESLVISREGRGLDECY